MNRAGVDSREAFVCLLRRTGTAIRLLFQFAMLSRYASQRVMAPASALCSSISICRNGFPRSSSLKYLRMNESGPQEKFPITMG